jgi:hypothetical protein
MPRIALIMGLLSLCLPALAGEKTAVVYNRYPGPSLHGKIACSMRLESALRNMGYRLLPATSKEKAYLKVASWGRCYNRGMVNYVCYAKAKVYRGTRQIYYIESGDVTSNTDGWSRDEACRELTKKLRSRLGGGTGKSGDDPVVRKPKKISRVVSVLWTGEMKPMPLIKLTGFFKDMGYSAKMLESGANQVKFRVTFEEPVGQFHSKLQTLLEAHYRIKSASGKSKLNFLIEAQ